jgi:ornithine decarboxylase
MFLYLNDGVYGTLSNVMFDHAHPVPRPLHGDDTAPLKRAVLWGPTCDSMDCINRLALLPDLKAGDWLVFEVGLCSINYISAHV